jgi:hypothetical protein
MSRGVMAHQSTWLVIAGDPPVSPSESLSLDGAWTVSLDLRRPANWKLAPGRMPEWLFKSGARYAECYTGRETYWIDLK